MKTLLVFTAITLALMVRAWAGDAQTPVLSVPQQTDSQDHNWTGFYMGVQGGYAGGTVNSNGPMIEQRRDGNSGQPDPSSR